MKLLIVAIVIVVASIAMYMLKLLFSQFSDNSKIIRQTYAYFPIFTLLVWIGIVFWSIYFLFYEKEYYDFIIFLAIILLVLGIGWFFVKDFMAGIVFKVQNKYIQGEEVQLGEVRGKTENLLLTHITVRTNEGQLIKIPYSKLSNQIVSQVNSGSFATYNSFVIAIPKKEDAENTKTTLQNLLQNSPWIIAKTQAVVTLKNELSDFYEFEIKIAARNERHSEYIEQYIKRRMQGEK